MTRAELLARLAAEGRRDGITATYEEYPPMDSPLIFTEHHIGAGTDAETGLAELRIEGSSSNGRYLLSREATLKLAGELLAAVDPGLVAELVLARARQPREVI